MNISKEALKKIKHFKESLQDKRTQEVVKKKVVLGIKKGKAKLTKWKGQFQDGEKKAVAFTKSNPRKALAVAAAAGIVAGTTLAMLRRKKKAKS